MTMIKEFYLGYSISPDGKVYNPRGGELSRYIHEYKSKAFVYIKKKRFDLAKLLAQSFLEDFDELKHQAYFDKLEPDALTLENLAIRNKPLGYITPSNMRSVKIYLSRGYTLHAIVTLTGIPRYTLEKMIAGFNKK